MKIKRHFLVDDERIYLTVDTEHLTLCTLGAHRSFPTQFTLLRLSRVKTASEGCLHNFYAVRSVLAAAWIQYSVIQCTVLNTAFWHIAKHTKNCPLAHCARHTACTQHTTWCPAPCVSVTACSTLCVSVLHTVCVCYTLCECVTLCVRVLHHIYCVLHTVCVCYTLCVCVTPCVLPTRTFSFSSTLPPSQALPPTLVRES